MPRLWNTISSPTQVSETTAIGRDPRHRTGSRGQHGFPAWRPQRFSVVEATEGPGAALPAGRAPTAEERARRSAVTGGDVAAMFTEDGVYDSPLAPDGHALRRLVGRDAIRTGTRLYHQQPTYQGTMNVERSAYVLHDTAEPDVFIARSGCARAVRRRVLSATIQPR